MLEDGEVVDDREDALQRLGYRVYLRRCREIRPASTEHLASWWLPLAADRVFGYPPANNRAHIMLMERLVGGETIGWDKPGV